MTGDGRGEVGVNERGGFAGEKDGMDRWDRRCEVEGEARLRRARRAARLAVSSAVGIRGERRT